MELFFVDLAQTTASVFLTITTTECVSAFKATTGICLNPFMCPAQVSQKIKVAILAESLK